ncbi:MAG: small multi-drug export protein [Dehalococcoidia bacterium]
MVEQLIQAGIPRELIVIIISALPVLELRGALPVAINILHIPWYWSFLLVIIGNLLPVPFILLFLESVAKGISRLDSGKRLVDWLFRRTRKRGRIIERYERIGLTLFVAIPLPFTGAWTGSIAAFLFGLKFYRSLLLIFFGIIIAAVIVTILCLLGWLGAVIAGVGLASLVVIGLWKSW